MNIKDFKKKYKNNIEGLISYYKKLEYLLIKNKKLNFYTNLRFEKIYKMLGNEEFIKSYKEKDLFGIPFFIKDNFWISDKGKTTEAGSKILKNFEPRMNAFIVQILKDSGALFAGTTNMDELGLGGTGLENERPVINPLNYSKIVGGSSSGAAVTEYLTALNNFCSFSLGSDTGDSVRVPAAFLGLIGFKPSYGLISRRGLIPYAPSLDTVGILSSNVQDLIQVCKLVFKKDKYDFTTQEPPIFKKMNFNYESKLNIGIFSDDKLVSKEMKEKFENFILKLKRFKNFNIKNITVEQKIINSLALTYQMISYPEAISSQANLTGINFGSISNDKTNLNKSFDEQIIENRTKSFKNEVKRRYVIGSFFSKFDENNESWYLKGQKIRRYINDKFKIKLKKYDFIITPATFGSTFDIKQVNELKENPTNISPTMNEWLLISNFIGTPSIVLPIFKDKVKNYSINIMSDFKQDYKLLEFTELLEIWLKEKE